jgi:replicative DNA helicase
MTDQPMDEIVDGEPTMPHNEDAEESLIASILVNPSCLATIVPIVSPEDIFILRNRWVYESFLHLMQNNIPIDVVTVANDLKEQNRLDEAGGSARLFKLISTYGTSFNTESYAEIVAEYAVRRNSILTMSKMVNAAYDFKNKFDPSQYVDKFLCNSKNHARRTWNENLGAWWDWVSERIANPRDLSGLSTGIPGIDAMTDGFELGTTVVFSGLQKLGKSILCDQIALNIAKEKKGALIYTLEISDKMIVNRYMSNLSGIYTHHFKRGKVNEFQQTKLVESFAKLETDYGLDIIDDPTTTTSSIRSDIMRRRAQGKEVNIIVIDYLDLLADELQRGEVDLDRQLRCLRNITKISKEMNVIALVVHTLNKDKVISGRQGIKYACDIAISMYQTDENNHTPDGKRYVTLEVTDIRDQNESGNNKADLARRKLYPFFDDVTVVNKPE